MWRAVFLAFGIMAMIIGIECLVIDSANLYAAGDTNARSFMNPAGVPSANTKAWQPREWFPWMILSVGTITVLYAFTLPQRFRQMA
jgi:hypothetical protein